MELHLSKEWYEKNLPHDNPEVAVGIPVNALDAAAAIPPQSSPIRTPPLTPGTAASKADGTNPMPVE